MHRIFFSCWLFYNLCLKTLLKMIVLTHSVKRETNRPRTLKFRTFSPLPASQRTENKKKYYLNKT